MSISTPSSGKNPPPCGHDAESRRIGAANQTSLAFIGGHQPTWMSSSGSASSPSAKSPTGIRRRRQFSRPLPEPLPLDKVINATMSVQQDQTQDSQPSTQVAETGSTNDLPELSEKSPESVSPGHGNMKHASPPSPSLSPLPLPLPLPPPAPLPVDSGSATMERPRVISRGPFPSPPPALPMESRSPEIEKVAGQVIVQDACANDGGVASDATIPMPHRDPSLPHRTSRSSYAPAVNQVSPPLPQQDGGWKQPAQPVPQQIHLGGFVYQLMKPVRSQNMNHNPELHTNATASVACRASSYRPPPESPVQPDMSYLHQDNIDTWRQRLVEYINRPKGTNGDAASLEAWRCSALLDACQCNDVFFLVLHQFHCLWSINPVFLRSILPNFCQSHLGPAFGLLATVLKPSTGFRMQHLSWFAQYPYSSETPADTYPSFYGTQYPIMVHEMKEHLNCHSLGVQNVLFTYSWRHLAPGHRLVAADFNYVFQADRENEAQAEVQFNWPHVHEVRKSIRQNYINIASHMISQSSMTMAAGRFANPQNLPCSVASVSTVFSNSPSPHDLSNPGPPQFVQGQSPNIPPQSQPPPPPPNVIPQTRVVSSSAGPIQQHPREAGHVASQIAVPGQQRSGRSSHIKTHSHHLPHHGSLALRPTSQITKNRHSSHERQVQKRLVANVHAGMARAQGAPPGSSFSTVPLGETEYPQSQHDWTSVQSGLHLVRSRSPQRVNTQGPRTQHYQYLDRFAVTPTVLFRQNGTIQTFDFAVTSTEFAERSRLVRTEEAMVHQYQQGALRYRLRLSGQLPDNTTDCIADWASSPCIWPLEVYIKFNDEVVFPLRPQHFHQDLPIELTDMIRPGFNTVKMSLPETAENYKETSVYHLAVEVIKTMDHESTLAMVMEMEAFSVEQTEKEIERRLRPDDSGDVLVQDDSLCISLMDPFSAGMVKSPVRGLRCKHIECFDLEIWLQTRHSKPSQSKTEPALADGWKCPICGEYAGPLSLRIDAYLLKVRKALIDAGKEQSKSIKVSQGGNWTVIEEPKDDDDGEHDGPEEQLPHKRADPDIIEILDD